MLAWAFLAGMIRGVLLYMEWKVEKNNSQNEQQDDSGSNA